MGRYLVLPTAILMLAGSLPATCDHRMPATDTASRVEARLPIPPRQNDPWTPPPTTLPATFISTVAVLFHQGLPDPRGCEYRSVGVMVQSRLTWSWLFASGVQEVQERHGWVLPRVEGERRRFVILPDGVLAQALSIGSPADLAQDAEQAITTSTASWSGALWPVMLVRLGERELAERAWRSRPARAAEYREAAREWLRSLFDHATREHMRGDDRLALMHLRELKRALDSVMEELQRRKAFSGYKNQAEARVQLGFGFLDDVAPLLVDQERRAREPRRVPALDLGRGQFRRQEEWIAALIRDLDQVDQQPTPLDNPGSPDLDQDPIVTTLIGEGKEAVEPLIECVEQDSRLTRSDGYWRFFTYSGEMVPVYSAAYAALAGILGSEEVEKVRAAAVGELASADPRYRKRVADGLRTYWRERKAGRIALGWEKPISLRRPAVPLREALELIYEATGLRYSIMDRVPDIPVDLDFRGITAREALRELVRRVRRKVPGFHAVTDTDVWIYKVPPRPAVLPPLENPPQRKERLP